MASADTRNKILDAAESLFTQNGINGVSLREIAAKAAIGISHLQYHFKTKEDLYHSVFERRIRAINADRLTRLDTIERASGFDSAHLEDIVRALVEPMVLRSSDVKSGGANYATLMNQVINDPAEYARRISQEFFDPIARATIEALADALPDLDMSSRPWTYIFAVGAMTASISRTDRVKLLSDDACDPLDVRRTVSLLVPFITGGMRAVDAAEKARRAVDSRTKGRPATAARDKPAKPAPATKKPAAQRPPVAAAEAAKPAQRGRKKTV